MDLIILPVVEVFGNDVIGGKFDAHGVAIEEDEDPSSVIGDSVPQDL